MIFKSLLDHARTAASLYSLFFLLCIYVVFRIAYKDPIEHLPANLKKYLNNEDHVGRNSTLDIKWLKLQLENMNWKSNITNLDKYIPVEDDTPILVIQVHKDLRRLQYLIFSLAQVQDIENSLLIFSHSYYHESINRLVESINFSKVMQIFYPYSIQLNPHKFPGVDREDCPPGNETSTAFCIKRDATVTEHKQHWWWKANFVFHKLDWSKSHTALVIFLEESNCVAPDMLHMLQYMQRSFDYFPYVEVVSFGRPRTRSTDRDLLILEQWRPPFDVGLAFNKTTWMKILSFSAQFCMYDDFSWSYSLFNLFQNFPAGYANMIGCLTPRVLSTKEIIDTKSILKIYSDTFNSMKLFPEKVKAVHLFGKYGKVERIIQTPPAGSGGWNDLRDQVLCLDPLFSTTTEENKYYDAEVTRT